jgi:hypothetical protein
MGDSGAIGFVRDSVDWHTVADENEAFYLRVDGVGEYSYLKPVFTECCDASAAANTNVEPLGANHQVLWV